MTGPVIGVLCVSLCGGRVWVNCVLEWKLDQVQRDRDASNDYGYENREMPYKGIEKRIRQATKTQEGKNKKSIDRTRGVLTFSFFLFFSLSQWFPSNELQGIIICIGSGESYKQWIMIQYPKTVSCKEGKEREKKPKKQIISPAVVFFLPGMSWHTETGQDLTSQSLTGRTYAGFCGHGGQRHQKKFPSHIPRLLSSHTKRTQVAWRTCGSFLRLQAGTARRTPIESAPLKKRPIEPGKRSTSLHPGQIDSVSSKTAKR